MAESETEFRGGISKMSKEEVPKKLTQAKPQLAKRYGVTRLALFGSTARNEGHPGSNVDIVVGFDGRRVRRYSPSSRFTLRDHGISYRDYVEQRTYLHETWGAAPCLAFRCDDAWRGLFVSG
jgi:predicted nucleotidyltransferase